MVAGLLCTLAGGQRSGRPLEGGQEGEGVTDSPGLSLFLLSSCGSLSSFQLRRDPRTLAHTSPRLASVSLKSSTAFLASTSSSGCLFSLRSLAPNPVSDSTSVRGTWPVGLFGLLENTGFTTAVLWLLVSTSVPSLSAFQTPSSVCLPLVGGWMQLTRTGSWWGCSPNMSASHGNKCLKSTKDPSILAQGSPPPFGSSESHGLPPPSFSWDPPFPGH